MRSIQPTKGFPSFYDEAPYDRNYDSLLARQQIVNPVLEQLVQLNAGKTVLDIGCGCGHNLLLASRYARLAIGVDYSAASVRITSQRVNSRNAYLLQGDNLNLCFRDELADLVISDGVVHHTGDTQRALRECVRVLKPSGYLYLAIYSNGSPYEWLYNYVGGCLRAVKSIPKVGNALIDRFFVPLHYLLYYAKYLRQKRHLSMRTTRSVFYDYFLTPVATFQSKDTVVSWVHQNDCSVEGYERVKHSHHFVIKKHEVI